MSLFAHLPDYRNPDCDYFCVNCGLKVCRDQDPSPAEDEHICSTCINEHGPQGSCRCCSRTTAEQLEAIEAAIAAGPPPYDAETDPSVADSDLPCGICGGRGWVEMPAFFYTRDMKDTAPCWACEWRKR